MIDIHTHIIYNIDDGARSLEESIDIIKKLNKIGFTHIIATPHYITGSNFISNNYQKQEELENLKRTLKNEEIPVYLYLGNEIFIDAEILSLMKKNEITSLNGSHYLLIEFPVSRPFPEMLELLFYFRSKNYIPIIAHPERYLYLQDNPHLISKFLEMGCLFQGNFSNIIGKYGKKAKKLFLEMLKKNQYHFLATDVHHIEDSLFLKMDKIKKEIIRITSEEKFRELTYENPLKVLKDENIKEKKGNIIEK